MTLAIVLLPYLLPLPVPHTTYVHSRARTVHANATRGMEAKVPATIINCYSTVEAQSWKEHIACFNDK